MWLSLAIAILTYLLSPKGTSSQRSRALLTAAAVGGATFLATENTDWGRDISDKFDGAIGINPTPIDGAAADASTGSVIRKDVPGTASGSGLWSTLQGWGAGGTAAVAALLGSATGLLPSWVFPAGLALGAYLLFKD